MIRPVQFRVRFPVDDGGLSRLHARAFGDDEQSTPWRARLERHSLTWVGAFEAEVLVGFVQVCWDGGPHAFLLDTVVDPDHQRRGIGRLLVETASEEAERAGCAWLHVDFDGRLEPFYRDACGFRPTQAGLLRLAR